MDPEINAAPDVSDTASSDVNWLEVDGESGDEAAMDIPADVSPSEPPPQQTPPAPVQETPVASPEQTPPSVQQVQQPQTPVESQQPQPSQEERFAQYQQALQQAYALTADDATALLTQPEAVLPKLAMTVHTNVMREVQANIHHMMQAIPAMLQVEAQRVQAEESAKNDFYVVWPGLKANHDVVVRNANMIRAANPSATRKQVIEMAGMLTAAALGVDPSTLRGQPAQRQQATSQRAQMVRPVNVAGSPAGLQPPPQNTFSAFADEDLNF